MKNITQFNMKRVNLIVLILALISTQLLSSCIDKEFRKEARFVKNILENLDNIDSIIVNSEFYDKRFFNFETDLDRSFIHNIKENQIEFSLNGYMMNVSYKCIRFEKIKFIEFYKKNSGSVYFIIKFAKIDDKYYLIEIK